MTRAAGVGDLGCVRSDMPGAVRHARGIWGWVYCCLTLPMYVLDKIAFIIYHIYNPTICS